MSGRRVRVLHAVLNIHEGGLERVVGDLVRCTNPATFEVHVLALNFLGRLAEGLDAYARLHVARPMGRLSMLRPASLAEDIRRIAPDVLHSHSGVWYKASRAARMAGVPRIIHTDHGRQSPDPWMHRFVDGLASRRTDVVVAVSEVLARQLAATVVADPARVVVVPNGIDTARFRRHEHPGIRAARGIPAAAPVLGSIGRLDPIKRFDVMVEAFERLTATWAAGAPPHLVIAGDGPERDRLARQAAASPARDRIHLLGWYEDVPALHATFTVFTMSSRSEGTSIGLLEAMSAELCPVVTDVGGNAAVLGPELCHRLCRAEDPEALAQAWRDALADRVRLRRDELAARRRVTEAFSIDVMVRAYARLYAGNDADPGAADGARGRPSSR